MSWRWLSYRGAVGLLIAAVLSSGACSSSSPRPPAAAPLESWANVAATLAPEMNTRSPNPCQRGVAACLDILVNEMQTRAERLASECDHNALFATMYLRMTEAIRGAVRAGRFNNPRLTIHLTAWFAHFYFKAIDAWHSGNVAAVPGAWQIAFQASASGDQWGLGDLLLGMNAHISRDLPFAVAGVIGNTPTSLDPDHDFALVNTLILQISQGVLQEVASRFDPTVAAGEVPFALGAGQTFGQIVTAWRTESWQSGVELAGAATPVPNAISEKVEATAESRAQAIHASLTYLPVIEGPAARDAYCAADHG